MAAELQRTDLCMWLYDDTFEELDAQQPQGTLPSEEKECKPVGYYVNRLDIGLFPAPLPQDSEVCEKACRYFWFLGVFLAKVLQDMRLVDLPLSSSFLQLLCHNKMPQQNLSSSILSQVHTSGVLAEGCNSNDDLMSSSALSEESTELADICSKLLNQSCNHNNNGDSSVTSDDLLMQRHRSDFSTTSKWYEGILTFENLAEIDPIRYEFIKMLQDLVARKQAIESNNQLSRESKEYQILELKLRISTSEEAECDEENEVYLSDLALNFVYLPTSAIYGYEYVELIPNGIEIAVDINNLEEYCDLLVNFMLQDGIAKQLDAFHDGFCQVFPLKKLAAFSPDEARMMICGEQHPQWTREDLINYTEPKLGYSKDRFVAKLYSAFLLFNCLFVFFIFSLVLDFCVL